MTKHLISLFITMGLLALSGCSTINVNDHEFCLDKGILGARCRHTLTDEVRDLSAVEWRELSFGQICTADPPDDFGGTFADMKATMEKLCSTCNCCSYKTKAKIEKFFTKIKTMQTQDTIDYD